MDNYTRQRLTDIFLNLKIIDGEPISRKIEHRREDESTEIQILLESGRSVTLEWEKDFVIDKDYSNLTMEEVKRSIGELDTKIIASEFRGMISDKRMIIAMHYTNLTRFQEKWGLTREEMREHNANIIKRSKEQKIGILRASCDYLVEIEDKIENTQVNEQETTTN